MNVVFIANTELNENEGIYKKIFAQAQALKNANGDGWLITKKDGGSQVVDLQNMSTTTYPETVFQSAQRLINNKSIRLAYIRHMIPSPALINMLGMMKKNKVEIYYEIPTYPYYAEQYRTAVKKHRAIAKLTLDTIFWPLIYRKIDHLVVIKSNRHAKMYKKMVEITNGARIDNIAEKVYSEETPKKMSMVAVGTIYPYHGYDRLLDGLHRYNQSNPVIPVEFHVVGASPTIDDLKKTAKELEMKNVIFHGIKTTEELNDLYKGFDVGVGSVALYRRNADIDTTIKAIEYYCRGVPVITSGTTPMDSIDKSVTIHVKNDDSPLDIEKIVGDYLQISYDEKKAIAKEAKQFLSWDAIMTGLCHMNT